MKVLHLLRSPGDERALATARTHARHHETALLLLHEAVHARVHDFPGVVYACVEDAPGEETPYRAVDCDEVVRLLFEHDRVVVW